MNISANDFPALDPSKKASWAAILCHPKESSLESFVVGIVAIDSDGYHIEAANQLSRLGCFYERRAMPLLLSIEIAISWLEDTLSTGVKSLDQLSLPVGNISISNSRHSVGLPCKELARLWMSSLSSLYKAKELEAKTVASAMVARATNEVENRKLRLPVQVFGIIEFENSKLLEYFHEDVRNRSARRVRANARIKIDYDGLNLSANIDRFNVDTPSQTLGLLKERMWDLAIQREKKSATLSAGKEFEMLVGFPQHRIADKSQKSVERIHANLKELIDQANKEQIRLRTLSDARAIGEHILELEAA